MKGPLGNAGGSAATAPPGHAGCFLSIGAGSTKLLHLHLAVSQPKQNQESRDDNLEFKMHVIYFAHDELLKGQGILAGLSYHYPFVTDSVLI